jgi:hypothetical protein
MRFAALGSVIHPNPLIGAAQSDATLEHLLVRHE